MTPKEAQIFVKLMREYIPLLGTDEELDACQAVETLNYMLMQAFNTDPSLMFEETQQNLISEEE